jgi:hypothetical protein
MVVLPASVGKNNGPTHLFGKSGVDVEADAAFDTLKSLEHSTQSAHFHRVRESFDSAYSGMKALEAFAQSTMQGDAPSRQISYSQGRVSSLNRKKVNVRHQVLAQVDGSIPMPP